MPPHVSTPHLPIVPAFLRRSGLRRVVVPGLLIALAAAGCGRKAAGPGGFTMPPMPVEVADVQPQTVRDQFRALGSIESDEIIEVVSELDGIVRRIRFQEGHPVAKGAILVELDDRETRAEAARSVAQREQAKLNYDRSEKLHEQQVVSVQELDNARTSLHVAEANEALAKARLDKARIRAPWGGLVGRKRISEGAYVRAGNVITELARVDEMKVSFSAPERYLGAVREGRPVEIRTPAYPQQRFVGTISVVDPIVNPASRTFQLVARIPNTGRVLRPGMSANVILTFAERTKALVVPDEAVFAEGAQNYVYVVKPDSTVTRTAITTGTRDSSHVEVLSGLSAGVRVVTAGHQKLFEGARVMPVPDEAEGGSEAGGAAGPAGTSAKKAAPSRPQGGAR